MRSLLASSLLPLMRFPLARNVGFVIYDQTPNQSPEPTAVGRFIFTSSVCLFILVSVLPRVTPP
jgi:hypothetical protein